MNKPKTPTIDHAQELLDMLDRIHAAMDGVGEMPSFEEIGVLIAVAKGDCEPLDLFR